MSLSARQKLFVQEYLIDGNGAQAAIRAGYAEVCAKVTASRLLTNANVKEAIEAGLKKKESRAEFKADDVLNHFLDIATADPNELIEHRRICCRYCYGAEHRWQRTAGEMYRDRVGHAKLVDAERHKKKPKEIDPFDEQGGIGFDPRKVPHVDCPECFGEGEGQVYAKDTRKLSPAARKLYAGVKATKDGLEIKVHDQAAAMVNVGKLKGLFADRVEHTGKDGKEIEMKHEHSISEPLAAKLDSYTDAFLAAANREETSDPPSDGSGKPVDTGGNKGGSDGQAS